MADNKNKPLNKTAVKRMADAVYGYTQFLTYATQGLSPEESAKVRESFDETYGQIGALVNDVNKLQDKKSLLQGDVYTLTGLYERFGAIGNLNAKYEEAQKEVTRLQDELSRASMGSKDADEIANKEAEIADLKSQKEKDAISILDLKTQLEASKNIVAVYDMFLNVFAKKDDEGHSYSDKLQGKSTATLKVEDLEGMREEISKILESDAYKALKNKVDDPIVNAISIIGVTLATAKERNAYNEDAILYKKQRNVAIGAAIGFGVAAIIGVGACLGVSCGNNKGNNDGITQSQLEAVLNSSTFLDKILNGEGVSQEEIDAFKAQLESLKNSGKEALQNYATQQESLYNALLKFANSGSNEAKMEAYNQLLGALYNAKSQYTAALQDGTLTEDEKNQVLDALQNIDQLEAQLNSALGTENYYNGMFSFMSDLLSAKASVNSLEDSHSKSYKDVIQAVNGVFAAYTENLQDNKLSDAEKTELMNKLGAIKDTAEYKELNDEEKAQVDSVVNMATSMVNGRMSYEQLAAELDTVGSLNQIYDDYKSQGADGLNEQERADLLDRANGIAADGKAAKVKDALIELLNGASADPNKLEAIAALSNVYNKYKSQSADGLDEQEKAALLSDLDAVNVDGFADAANIKEAINALIEGKSSLDAAEANRSVAEAYNNFGNSIKDLNGKFDIAAEDGVFSEEEQQAINEAIESIRNSLDYKTLSDYNKEGTEAILNTFVNRFTENLNMCAAALQLRDLMAQYGVHDYDGLVAKLLEQAEKAGNFDAIFTIMFGRSPESMPKEELDALLQNLGMGSGSGSVQQPTPGNPSDEKQF